MADRWARVPLRDLISIAHGYAFEGKYFSEAPSDAVLLTPGNFEIGGGFRSGKPKYYDGPVPPGYVLPAGDLIVTMTDLSKDADTLGFPARVPEMPDGRLALHNQRLGRVRVIDDRLDPNFLYYALCGQEYRDEVLASATGTTVHHTSPDRILRHEVQLPPLREQRAISATLRPIDDRIDSNARAQTLLETLARTHFQRLFSVERSPEGPAISQLIGINPKRVLSKGQLATYVGMGSLPENSAEVANWQEKEFGSGQRFTNGDVLMARITPCLENGKTAIVDMLRDREVGWGSTEYIVLEPRGAITTAWIYCLVRTEEIRSFAIRGMTGTSGRQRFQASGFATYRIAEPDPNRLAEFNELALPLFKKMTQLRDENRSLSALRDTLIPQMLSGGIRTVATEVAAA